MYKRQGETVTCTFTNTVQSGTVVIKKATVPAGAEGTFEFNSTIPGCQSFTLSDGETKTCSVIPGTGVLREGPGSTRYLIPDVLVVQASAITDAALNLDPADVVLVVEVVSPSSMTHDRITKREVYARLGIPHYWLVESDRPGAIIALTLDESGVYVPVAEVVGEDELVLDQPFPVRIIPAALRR